MYKNWSITKGADAAPIFPVEYKEWKWKKGNIKSDIENCSYKYTPPPAIRNWFSFFLGGGGVLSLLGKIFELQVYYAKPTHTPRNRNFMTLGNALFFIILLVKIFYDFCSICFRHHCLHLYTNQIIYSWRQKNISIEFFQYPAYYSSFIHVISLDLRFSRI